MDIDHVTTFANHDLAVRRCFAGRVWSGVSPRLTPDVVS